VIISWVPKGEHNLREVVRVPREKAVIENCVDSGWGLRPHLFLGFLIINNVDNDEGLLFLCLTKSLEEDSLINEWN